MYTLNCEYCGESLFDDSWADFCSKTCKRKYEEAKEIGTINREFEGGIIED